MHLNKGARYSFIYLGISVDLGVACKMSCIYWIQNANNRRDNGIIYTLLIQVLIINSFFLSEQQFKFSNVRRANCFSESIKCKGWIRDKSILLHSLIQSNHIRGKPFLFIHPTYDKWIIKPNGKLLWKHILYSDQIQLNYLSIYYTLPSKGLEND